MTSRMVLPTPIGPLTLVASPSGLRAVLWSVDDATRVPGVALDETPSRSDKAPARSEGAIIDQAAEELDEYFEGARRSFDVPLDPVGTAFQRRAWAASVLFMTDGLEETEMWEHLFRRLPGICKDVRIVTVHSRLEETPHYKGDVRFVDIESGSEVEVTVTKHSVSKYIEEKSAHEGRLFTLARKFGISLLRTEVSDGAMETVTKKMRHAGWLR